MASEEPRGGRCGAPCETVDGYCERRVNDGGYCPDHAEQEAMIDALEAKFSEMTENQTEIVKAVVNLTEIVEAGTMALESPTEGGENRPIGPSPVIRAEGRAFY
jgi:hypothetical protein